MLFLQASSKRLSDIAKNLSGTIDARRILASDAIAERATSYWNPSPMQAAALVMPESTEEVAAVLRHCHAAHQPVVTQGGLTNCVAAAEPQLSDTVLSTEKMSGILDIDTIGGTVVVEAGAVLQAVQEAVAERGFRFPLDLGARGSCTIGGNIATNAGGINVLRYGMTRNLVLGLDTVLADGTVISSMNRMLKNNAGYDTKQLFIGSEGTLGIVTRSVLRIFPAPEQRMDALVAFTDFDKVIEFLGRAQRDLAATLSGFEVMWGGYFRAVTEAGGHRAPLSRDYGFYVVMQAEGSAADEGTFQRLLERALDDGIICDAVIPKSEREVRDIWNVREEFDALLQPAPCYLYDVSLPIRDMQRYVDAVERRVAARWPDGACYTLGHMADGNLHFFVRPNDPAADHKDSDVCVYEPLAAYGGSVSAEHGIGTEKLDWLPRSRSAADIALMAALKRSIDPRGILNPGRVVR